MSNKKYGLQDDGSYVPAPRVQDALSQMLKGLGFDGMAEDVLTEGDRCYLKRYAAVIANNFPATDVSRRNQVLSSLRTLRLI